MSDVEAELEARMAEIAMLRSELDETNRGLLALHKELEDARQAEARLAAIVQSSDDAMYSITTDRRIDGWNQGAERLFGYKAEEVVGRSIRALIPDDLWPEFEATLARLQTNRSASYDTWRRRKDGTLVEVAVTLSAMRDPGGRPFGYSAVLRDLTARRRAEADLAAARAAQEVLAARDRIARDLHDGAIQAIFAVGMHLQGTATMTDDAALRERMEAMVVQLDAVIGDLRRHIYGIHAGDTGGLGQTLRSVAAEIGGRRGMRVSLDVDDEVAVRIQAYAEELTHVVREALSNASRHGHASTCEVSLHRVRDHAVLEIRDDGSGFDPSRARRGQGLENFRWRAARVGGEVELTSVPGEGTTIRLSLPI